MTLLLLYRTYSLLLDVGKNNRVGPRFNPDKSTTASLPETSVTQILPPLFPRVSACRWPPVKSLVQYLAL